MEPPAATGATRRRRRLSDAETERRMLDTAKEAVNAEGLTVSLDHLAFEDVIRAAGVSRSAVYRRWPYKDLFFSDLLRELARGDGPVVGGFDADAVARMHRIILERLDWLRTPQLRLALVGEILRQGAPREVAGFHSSPEWRTYFALHATFLSLADGAFRSEVQEALTASEAALGDRLAGSYAATAGLLGLRLRPGASFRALADLANALMRGLVAAVPTHPGLTADTVRANPLGAPGDADWTTPALGLAALLTAYLEPDSGAVFDDARLAGVRRTIEAGWDGTVLPAAAPPAAPSGRARNGDGRS
ncbi:TetR/AcrR family transcriptional regulator [Nocardiopsis coralliicola]